MATDSSSTIISAKRVPLDDDRGKIDITYYDEDQAGPHEKSKVYKLVIQKTGMITGKYFHISLGFTRSPIRLCRARTDNLLKLVEDLLSYLCNTEAAAVLEAQEETIQALNIVMAKRANTVSGIVPYGQNKYFVLESNPESLSGGLVALRGYYSSVRTSNARILLNLNVCTSAFYSPVPLWKLIADFLGGTEPPTRSGWHPPLVAKLRTFLKGLRVETSYLKSGGVAQKRVKTIIGLSGKHGFGKGARDVTFQTDNGISNVETWFMKGIFPFVTPLRTQ